MTIKTLIDSTKSIALANPRIKEFHYGPLDQLNKWDNVNYVLAYLEHPILSTITDLSTGKKEYRFTLGLYNTMPTDLPALEYEQAIIDRQSELLSTVEKLITELEVQYKELDGSNLLASISISPLLGDLFDYLLGCQAELTITSVIDANICVD